MPVTTFTLAGHIGKNARQDCRGGGYQDTKAS
jgi:hypothetical protein